MRRQPKLASHDRGLLNQVLDACLMCHIAFVEQGAPRILTTLFWRDRDKVYWHGSRGSSALKAGAAGEVCFSVACLDGLVLARSAFHHTANYRSVVIYGAPSPVPPEAQLEQLRRLMERISPDRWNRVRPPSEAELRVTRIFSLPIQEAVCKLRTGSVIDDPGDVSWPVWAGVVPIHQRTGEPVPDPMCAGRVGQLGPRLPKVLRGARRTV